MTPDLSTWGKAMGNGFSVAALAGRRELMELGGLRTDRPRAFLLSSTNGAETTGLAAFRAVVRAYTDRRPGPTRWRSMERQGRALAEGVNAAAAEAGIGEYLSVLGPPVVPDLPHRATPTGDRRRRCAPCSCRRSCAAACSASRS